MIWIEKRRTFRIPLTVVAILFAVGVGFCAWSPKVTVEQPGPTRPVSNLAESEPDHVLESPQVASYGHAEPSMATRMKDARDLRVFYIEGIKNPHAGGVTYAGYVISLCTVAETLASGNLIDWRLADLPYGSPLSTPDTDLDAGPDPAVRTPLVPVGAIEDPADYAVRNKAYHQIKAACQGFSDAELDIENAEELRRLARTQGDVLQQLKDQVESAVTQSDPSARKHALMAVLQNGDPLLISETLERLLMSSFDGRLTYWIDGNRVKIVESGVFKSALDALPCRLGLQCDERQPDVLAYCIGHGKCYSDRVALIEDQLPEAARPEFRQRLDKLEAAVRARDAGHFIP